MRREDAPTIRARGLRGSDAAPRRRTGPPAPRARTRWPACHGASSSVAYRPWIGVHHHRHPGEPAEDPSVEPGFGVVGVEHSDLLLAQHAPQLEDRLQVVAEAHAPGGGTERNVSDSGRLQLVHPGPWGADPQCLPSFFDDGEELGSDQESETEINRGEMSDAERPFPGCHHSGTSQSTLLRNVSSHIISLTSSTHSVTAAIVETSHGSFHRRRR